MRGVRAERLPFAYGFALAGVPADPLLPRAANGEPVLRVRRGGDPPEGLAVTLADGRPLVVEAAAGRAWFGGAPLGRHELLHPYLAAAAALTALGRGWDALHGGSVLLDGRALAIIGATGAGKSTLLAGLAQAGHAVLADDLTVVVDGRAQAGPRCLDLRNATAARLGLPTELVPVLGRERYRLVLPPAPRSAPLAGWLHLEPGERVEAEALRPAERLRLLAGGRYAAAPGPPPTKLLELARLPGWRLRRPLDWAIEAEVRERVLALPLP